MLAHLQGVVTDDVAPLSIRAVRSIQPLALPAGETDSLTIAVVHGDGTPQDLTGGQLLLTVRRHASDTSNLISRQASIDVGTGGTATFPLTVGDTLSLLGPHVYDVWFTDASGNRTQVVPYSPLQFLQALGQPGQSVTVPPSQSPLAQGPQGPPGPAPAGGANGQYVKRVSGAPAWAWLTPPTFNPLPTLADANFPDGTLAVDGSTGHLNKVAAGGASWEEVGGGGGITSATAPLTISGSNITIDPTNALLGGGAGSGWVGYQAGLALLLSPDQMAALAAQNGQAEISVTDGGSNTAGVLVTPTQVEVDCANLLLQGALTDFTGASSGDVLTWNGSKWVHGTTTAGMAIGNVVGSGTGKSVLFVDNSGNLGQDNANFQYDSSSHALTVATLYAPRMIESVVADAAIDANAALKVSTSTAGRYVMMDAADDPALFIGVASTSAGGAGSSFDGAFVAGLVTTMLSDGTATIPIGSGVVPSATVAGRVMAGAGGNVIGYNVGGLVAATLDAQVSVR